MAGKRPRIGIDKAGLAVEPLAPFGIERPVGLKVIELALADPRDEDTPDVPPTVLVGIEGDHLGRFGIINRVVEQHPHRRRRAAVDDKLHTLFLPSGTVAKQRAVGQGVAELQWRQRLLSV